MKLLVIFTSLLMSTLISFSQEGFSGGAINQGFNNRSDGGRFVNINIEDDPNIEGSQYLTEQFMSSKVSSMPGKIYGVRYNIFKDEMEFRDTNNDLFALSKSDDSVVITFTEPNVSYHLFKYKDDYKNVILQKGYFVKLNNEGPNFILKKKTILFFAEKQSKTGYDLAKPATYKSVKDRTYIKLASKEAAVLLETNKKKLAKNLFPSNSKEILNFIKTNKIKLSKDDDLIKFVAFLNTL
jgi:hypothetical protein|tara:strand:+ start:4194 stop:4910 length:717 start_codon:yes stop_codon:yes gene_type:complete